VLEELVGKTDNVIPREGRWRVYYLGFARSGWTPQARAFSEALPKTKVKGENWQAVGMLLRNVEEVDQELNEWTV
jgi:hypothetical protein